MRDKTVKVSVIIPLYNQEKYVRQCLDSILGQDLREIEVVCIDDGSTDGSLAEVRSVAAADSRVRVVSRENRGVGVTRNEGLMLSAGEYVIFMDPDDFYPTQTVLRRLYETAVAKNVDVCGGSLVIYNDETDTMDERKDFPNYFASEGYVNYSDFQFDYGYTRYVFRRSLLIQNGITFPNYKRFQDPPFFVNAMIAAKRFYTIPDYVYTYRWARKFSKWDSERALHLLGALFDDLVSAEKAGLWRLFDATLTRIQKDFCDVFRENSTDELNAVFDKVKKLCLDVAKQRAVRGKAKGRRSPAVSVVLPIYNAENYLRQCLESLRTQTLSDMEFICVNDGSTDRSVKIIREFIEKDPRFVLVDKPNGGYGHSINCGFAVALGKYIGIVEPDDFVAAEMYKTLYECAEAHQVDFVKGGIIFYWKDRPERHISICADKSLVGRILNPRYDHGIFNAVMNNVTGIYRRSFLEAHQIRLNETPGAAYQDNSLYLQLHYAAKRVFLMDREFYYYRQDNENSSINSKAKAFAIFEEYRLNDAILKDAPKKRKIFLGHYLYKKFKSYKFHFDRIDPNCRLEFLQRMVEEFKGHEQRGEINWSIMSPGHQGVLKSLLADYRVYYERYKNNVPTWGIQAHQAKPAENNVSGSGNRGLAGEKSVARLDKAPMAALFAKWKQKESKIKNNEDIKCFVYTKFKNYKAGLLKLPEDTILEAFSHIQKEFRLHDSRGEIPWQKMTPGHVGVLKAILTDYYPYAAKFLVSRANELATRCEKMILLNEKLRRDLTAAEKKLAQVQKEIVELKESEAYRVGMIVTSPVRKIWRRFIKEETGK